ncbi:MAG: hypothetical protein ACODAU_04685 [Myxococcota bacterium]
MQPRPLVLLALLGLSGCGGGGDDAIPPCEGSADGTLAPGGVVEVTAGSLSGTRVSLPEGASREDRYHVDAFDVEIGCGAEQVPEGYLPLGPAVQLAPTHLRLAREIPVRVPVHPELLPQDAHTGHIEVSYTGPGVDSPRVIPVASLQVVEGTEGAHLRFETRRLGTYQAITRADGPEPRDREYQFQAITGVSMGAGGAGLIGLRNPEQFDLVAPLGGPVDWIYQLEYIRTYHTGGFCTEQERQADPVACEMGSDVSRTPTRDLLHEHRQDFENWWYQDEYGGQGGTFDRRDLVSLLRDLTRMHGNPNTTRTDDVTSEPNITAPGVPDTWRTSPDPCGADQVVIPACEGTAPNCAPGTGFIDDEYNPDGQYPVITFCDGAQIVVDGSTDVGVWDPDGTNDFPVVPAVAVDVNGNGIRDPGEPVIRNGREPFEDCGLDGVCNPDEPGYDPVTNPDPNGDDYDFQFNPEGTEGNWLRDSVDGDPCNADGEDFDDVGLDGVAGTAQIPEGFDYGEDDGCWTRAQGTERMHARNPRGMALRMDGAELDDVDVWIDGGIRDLFNFSVVGDQLAGAFAARGRNLRLKNGHASLMPSPEDELDVLEADWDQAGKYVMVRYGDPDASEQDKIAGDGGHVGTAAQLLDRVLTVLYWMSARWPDGDRELTDDALCDGCESQFQFDFTAEGRTGPVGVVLPPGYYEPANADLEYPIVYFLHGYGQEPSDLLDIGFFLRDRMGNPTYGEQGRLQKMILVFPDGLCRGDECVQGTFYADAPEGNAPSPRMESWLLALTEHMRSEYRVKTPATHSVTE